MEGFLSYALPAARDVCAKYGIPISVHETDWGRVVKGNVYFGVKGAKGTAGGVTMATTEYDRGGRHAVRDTFRAFGSYAEAADDFGATVKGHKKWRNALLYANHPEQFIQVLRNGGYATDPRYVQNAVRKMREGILTEFDALCAPRR